jgi:hypothetical protein
MRDTEMIFWSKPKPQRQPEYEVVEREYCVEDLKLAFNCGEYGSPELSFESLVIANEFTTVVYAKDKLDSFLDEWKCTGFATFGDRMIPYSALRDAIVHRLPRVEKIQRIERKWS